MQKASETVLSATPGSWQDPTRKPTLGDTDIQVWRAPLNISNATLASFAACLDTDEQARAARFHFDRHRNQFIAARGWLRTITGWYLRTDPATLIFKYSDFGKPSINESVATVPLRFNLAHSGELALYAFTLRREVGIDIEVIDPKFASETIARQFFSPKEVAALLKFPINQRPHAFFDCWTRKEAFLKAQGMGLSLPLDQFEVSLKHDQPALLHTAWDAKEAARWSLKNIDAAPGYAAALAVPAGEYHLKHFQVNEESLMTQ
jgi:4'-phosphopantetheinyl transferase